MTLMYYDKSIGFYFQYFYIVRYRIVTTSMICDCVKKKWKCA